MVYSSGTLPAVLSIGCGTESQQLGSYGASLTVRMTLLMLIVDGDENLEDTFLTLSVVVVVPRYVESKRYFSPTNGLHQASNSLTSMQLE